MAANVRDEVSGNRGKAFSLYSKCMGGAKCQHSTIRFLFSKYCLGCCVECGLMRGQGSGRGCLSVPGRNSAELDAFVAQGMVAEARFSTDIEQRKLAS